MISPQTGEVRFSDGWTLKPQDPIGKLADYILSSKGLPIPEWRLYDAGVHASEFGDFEVSVVCGPDRKVSLIRLAHQHPFYEPETKVDGERRVFHEGVLEKELRAKKTHSWGDAFCRYDTQDRRDRIIIAYTGGVHGPQQIAEVLLNLEEHERLEQDSERRR